VPIYNATISPQPVGRPLAASAAQQIDVLKRRKSGESLRGIAQATGLSFSTVRTIVGNKTGTGRQSEHAKALRRHEYDRLRAAAYRARKKQRDALPKLIAELRKDGAALIKAAKGLGR